MPIERRYANIGGESHVKTANVRERLRGLYQELQPALVLHYVCRMHTRDDEHG